ncbi:Protein kinase domain-containing protein [Pleurotus pulmonarius]
MSPLAAGSSLSPLKPARSSSNSLKLESLSPEPSIRNVDYSSDIDAQDSGSASDSTLDDLDAVLNQYDFGYPLERMPVLPRRTSSPFAVSEEEMDDAYYSEYSESECSTSSSILYDIDFESVVDDLLAEQAFELPKLRKFIMVEPSVPSAQDAFMIRVLQTSSKAKELEILISLNEHEPRLDPWNPVPHLLSVVERDNVQRNRAGGGGGEDIGAVTFVCLEWLSKYNDPPFATVANYIDFIRQALEGLTFLHEQHITSLNYGTTESFMVDIGQRNAWMALNGAPTPASSVHKSESPTEGDECLHSLTPTQTASSQTASPLSSPQAQDPPNAPIFDRTRYPVRYYYTDFACATIIPPSSPHRDLFKKDVQDCGKMIEGLLQEMEVPQVASKMKALVNAMSSGTFGADDARKLFEALCKSLEAGLFEFELGKR